ncbi:MAG: polyphosphate polymerase domain-containing protein [Candidatus Delongbacteria bacterium]|nr:polyphosphate polymerase domain-containing protein [Candidatus Delongbacteria bacterium]MBN2833563.1 polyphosphate polymerase domain-containing protein [Candidatus Delongbacteria bacterium]
MDKNEPLYLERYELKYIITTDMIEPISKFVENYCYLDKYSERNSDYFYKINNIYFDSKDFTFLRNRLVGLEDRFNMRIRSYGDCSSNFVFLELKRKQKDIIKKYREKININEWDPNLYLKNIQDNDSKNKKIFYYNALRYEIEAKVATEYRRKAYISEYDEYARVTFDTDLRAYPKSDNLLKLDFNKMNSYDFETNFEDDGNVVLELKCYTSYVPYWMIDLIRQFDLKKRSFSKYMNAVKLSYFDDYFDYSRISVLH